MGDLGQVEGDAVGGLAGGGDALLVGEGGHLALELTHAARETCILLLLPLQLLPLLPFHLYFLQFGRHL